MTAVRYTAPTDNAEALAELLGVVYADLMFQLVDAARFNARTVAGALRVYPGPLPTGETNLIEKRIRQATSARWHALLEERETKEREHGEG